MEVVITEDASEDIAEGYEFYEEQAVGLGADFASFIMSELYSLTKLAGIHEVHFQKYHRKISNRFPFAIFYTVENEVIWIYAILDTRRDPEWISERLN